MQAAWLTAALSRAKKLPTLSRLLNPPKTRRLSGAEAARRRAEHEELARRMGGKRRGRE